MMQRMVAALVLLSAAATAQAADRIHTGWFSNVAVDGHDVVAYFDQGEPVKGSEAFSTEWRGAEWRFASREHLRAFERDPQKYAPAYGGYCAWAVAQGKTAAGDPAHWAIVDGRLYLNYDADIQAKWQANRAELIRRADRNWPGVIE